MSARYIIPARAHAYLLLLCGAVYIGFVVSSDGAPVVLVEVPSWLYLAFRVGCIYILLAFCLSLLPAFLRLAADLICSFSDEGVYDE